MSPFSELAEAPAVGRYLWGAVTGKACWCLFMAAAFSLFQADAQDFFRAESLQIEPTPKIFVPVSHPGDLETKLAVPIQQEKADPGPFQTALETWLKPKFVLRGRIETDAIVAAQSQESIDTLGDLRNGYGFRRVRLGAQGTVGDAARWVSEIEVAGGNVRLRDVFIGLTAFPWVRELRVGNFREPFSLEGATSSNFITFMERSPLNEFDPTRNWGIAGYWWPDSERSLFALGVFRDGTTNGGQSSGDGDNWAVTSRITGLPVYEADAAQSRLLHVGGAISLRRPLDGIVTFDVGPQSNLLTVEDDPPSPFLPRVTFLTNTQQVYNLQAAWVNGPFSLQSEWFGMAIQQANAGTVFLHGFYAYASYFLTGENRGYDLTRAAFGQVSVRRPVLRSSGGLGGGTGAVELTARFTYFDFDSPNMPLAIDGKFAGANLYQLTLGINWYLNDYTRLMFNYTGGFPEVGGQPSVSAHLLAARLAIYW